MLMFLNALSISKLKLVGYHANYHRPALETGFPVMDSHAAALLHAGQTPLGNDSVFDEDINASSIEKPSAEVVKSYRSIESGRYIYA